MQAFEHDRRGGRTLVLVMGLCIVLLLYSCATSRLVATWHDPVYAERGRLKDVLVIAVTKEETVRRLYEDLFVARLNREGVHAIPSYTLSRPDIKPDEESLDAAVREAGASAVLITRHLGTDTTEHYRPPQRVPMFADPYYSRMYGFYPMAYHEVYTPGYTYTVTSVFLEANLYDAESGSLVWSARSESRDPSLSRSYLQELVDIFAADLQGSGILEK